MAIIPSLRTTVFILVTLSSLVVLGICAHIEFLISGYPIGIYTSFAPFGLGVACLTVLSLPLLWALGNMDRRVFTSTVLFEIIWFFILWILWVGTAGDTIAGRSYYYPGGCIYSNYPQANQICYEITVVEALAFLNFFGAFVYYDVIFLFAIINTIRGRGIWTLSVKEATASTPDGVKPSVPVFQPQLNAPPVPQYQNYGAYPSNVPPTQPYGAYPQPVPPQGPPAQPYNAYPQHIPPQGPPPQQYGAYPQPVPQGHPAPPPGQVQYNYAPPVTSQQQAAYGNYSPSPTASTALLPPQPCYNSYPTQPSQPQHPSPSGYQGQPMIQEQGLPAPYESQ